MAKTTSTPVAKPVDVTATAVVTEPTGIAPENLEEEAVASEAVVSGDDFKKIVRDLLKEKDCKRFSGLKVKNVTLKDMDTYIRATLTLMSKVPGFVAVTDENGDPTGEYKQGLTNLIYTSSFAIAGILKNDEENAWLGNYIVNNPQGIGPLITGATIDVIQQFVPADTEYVNPFTTREYAEPIVNDHDMIIYHIVGLTLGKSGTKFADKMMEKVIDGMF